MLAKSIKISSKGQITLPKEVIRHLGNKVLKLEVLNGNEVKIIPIKDVGGRLSAYAKNASIKNFNTIRTEIWEEEVQRKFSQEHKND